MALITGRVEKPTSDTIAVSFRNSMADTQDHITYARLGDKGQFELRVPVTEATRADLVYGEAVADLYLDPEAMLDVSFKGKDLPGTIKFKALKAVAGREHQEQIANANTYLADFDTRFVSNYDFQVLPNNIRLYEAPFVAFLDYRTQQEQEFLKSRSADNAFTPEFVRYAAAEIVYSATNDRLAFADLREQMVNSEPRLALSPTYYDFLQKPGLLDDLAAGQNEQYQEFLLNYIHYVAAQNKYKRSDASFFVACYSLATERLHGAPQLLTLARVLQESFRYGHMRQSAAMLANFATVDTQHHYTAGLQAAFDQHQTLAIGAPAPDFALLSATGETVKLSDLKGKLVYLNFWTTTNGLCRNNLASAADLQHRFADKNVVFVNIALDEQETTWRQLVKEQHLPGVQLYAPGGMRAAVATAYHVAAAPTYLLLGEDGTILLNKPKGLGSRATVEELNSSFGKAGDYTAALAMLSPHSAGGGQH
ncbi:MAG: peroxiredoxin family protein [Janthinobacterium lividum]